MILSKFNRLLVLVSCLLLSGGLAQARGESVHITRAVELRETPGEGSRSLATRTPVTRSGRRQGAWVQVYAADRASGWVHIRTAAIALDVWRARRSGL